MGIARSEYVFACVDSPKKKRPFPPETSIATTLTRSYVLGLLIETFNVEQIETRVPCRRTQHTQLEEHNPHPNNSPHTHQPVHTVDDIEPGESLNMPVLSAFECTQATPHSV